MTVITIAGNAFLESIRQRIFIVLICVGILALVLNVNVAAYAFADDNKLLVDLGLSTLLLVGLLLAGFTATGVIGREIENKTVLTVVSKPVPRAAVVIGKYLGVTGAILLAFWILAVVFLLTVRHRVQASVRDEDIFDVPVLLFGIGAAAGSLAIAALANYFYRRPFTSTFAVCLGGGLTAALGIISFISRDWEPQHPLTDFNPQLLFAILLALEAILVLAAIAVAASTRLTQTATLLVCLGGFLLGLVSDYFLSLLAGADRLWTIWTLPAVIVPNLQYFWMADALTQGHPITGDYVVSVTLYAACMVLAFGGLAILLFQDRDVG
jgi:ABC-type transport system involved in multi-copper enzyme maturation permease subunit